MAITLDGTSGINTSGTLVATGSLTTSSSLTTGTGAVYNGLQASTAQVTTSGTSIDFTSIPSWVKRITVMLQGVSTSGTSNILFQIGSGSVTTSGYLNSQGVMASGTMSASYASSAGVLIGQAAAASLLSGHVILTNISSNTWVWSVTCGGSSTNFMLFAAGNIALGGVLDRVRLTTANGTDTFDAGSINILYE
jgi:hypothetical protein